MESASPIQSAKLANVVVSREVVTGIDRALASRVVVRFKAAANPRLRLLCLPYAGGNAVAFHPWAACLPDDVELWSAQYRGRGYRFNEKPFLQMSDVLDELEVAISPLLDVPTLVFGHSMGAVLAFQLVRRMALQAANMPEHLFLSGCAAPREGESGPTVLPDLSDAHLITRLHALAGTPAEVLTHPELRNTALQALRADLTCLHGSRTFLEPSLPVPITVFGGIDDPYAPPHSMKGWARGTTQAFDKQFFSGAHFFIRNARPEMIATMLRTVRP